MKHNKNADTLLFLLSFTKCHREKNIERTFFARAGAPKGWESAGFGTTLPLYLSNPKNEFPVKFIFTSSIFVLLSTSKKGKTISIKFLR